MNLQGKQYKIIYADPPWSYKLGNVEGDATKHYNTLPLDSIKSLSVDKIADKDSMLFLWATMPNLNIAFEVIEAWGFRYKTCAFTWVKQNPKGSGIFMGLGYWTRANAELCLLATRGKPRRVSNKVHSVIMSPVRRHSQKPDEARDRIVELCGDLPRIELFARDRVSGWDAWGNEI